MRKRYFIITFICTVLLCILFGIKVYITRDVGEKHIKVGYIFVGDASTPYTGNFMKAEESIREMYGNQVTNIVKYNIPEGMEEEALKELAEEGCDLIFTGSFGYGEAVKKYAEMYPNIEFVAATCDNSLTEPVLKNYHTFMGEIYQGRYVAGMVAGMKIKELIDRGILTEEQAKIGYVGAFPYAEVISGYTAFFLGVRSVVPSATMEVKYANTWSNYSLEEQLAEELIEDGCVIISQHSDTTGPAIACENASEDHIVYHVGYNQSMTDVAATTSLISCRINWEPYMRAAVKAVLSNEKIEKRVDASVNKVDSWAGFNKGWVEMLDLNTVIAAEGTEEAMEKTIHYLETNRLMVFKGEYTGTNPYDASDVIDLTYGYQENENSSAPSFHYVLDDVITVKE